MRERIAEVVPRRRGQGPTPPWKLLARLAARSRPDGECVVWTGHVAADGYPRFTSDGILLRPYRLAKVLAAGDSHEGRHIHHECRNKLCIRPDHLAVLDIVEHAHEHSKPAEFCQRGHSMADAYKRPDGTAKMCRKCSIMRAKRYWQRTKAQRPPIAERPCIQCHRPFVPVRNSTARYCGQPCRIAAFKERHGL